GVSFASASRQREASGCAQPVDGAARESYEVGGAPPRCGRACRATRTRGAHSGAACGAAPPLAHNSRVHDFSTTFEYVFDSVGESSMPSFPAYLAAFGDAATPFAVPAVAGFTDAELLDGQRAVAELRRRVDAVAAAFAGEIAHRSRRELGHAGLAQSNG